MIKDLIGPEHEILRVSTTWHKLDKEDDPVHRFEGAHGGWKLPICVMFEELEGGKRTAGGGKKS